MAVLMFIIMFIYVLKNSDYCLVKVIYVQYVVF